MKRILILLAMVPVVCGTAAVAAAATTSEAIDRTTGETGAQSHYIRGAYQMGTVLATNDFVEGKNARGEAIDRYHLARLEFGWQTSGDKDWHHLYNFPSWGVGLSAGDYFHDEELGRPTSLYGFFDWPVKRWGRRVLNVELGFGLTDNWVGFDEVTNPYNVAIGAGRSVYIDIGANVELPLARRWWLQLGFTGTHYSNGGSQQPNWGINQLGALAYVKHDLQPRVLPAVRRELAPLVAHWETAVTFAGGVRNLALDYRDNTDVPEEIRHYLQKNYPVFNAMLTLTRRFSHMSAWDAGLDLSYDGSLADLERVDAFENGRQPESIAFFEHLGVGVFGGYEHVVHDTRLILQLGYTAVRRSVPGQLPRLYQRLGLKHHVWTDAFFGLNVRFNDFSRANNLEFNIGYRFGT